MAKIVIYVNLERDLIDKYSSLTAQHDVYVRHHPREPRHMYWVPDHFRKWGFNPKNFQRGYGNPKEESADVYFLDVDGHCFVLLPDLPKDRAFVNSDSRSINEEAVKQGYNVVGSESVEAIVARILARS